MQSIVGKIHSIAIKDFVTYDEIKVFPGQYLNLILGPNGTGKSSLVAAIVIGMGGEPKLLSRSTDIRDYVKNGKTNAEIEIEIYKSPKSEKVIKFRRAFNTSGRSSYQVDGSIVTHSQYLKAIAEYNIQISNLCQFLPQDRVQDFAKMNSHELLISTQESICTPDMIERFQQLKKIRNLQRNGDKSLQNSEKRLKELEDRNAQLDGILEKIHVRQRILDDITIGEKKRTWLQFDELQQDFDKIKSLLENAQTEMERDEKKFKQITKQAKNGMAKRESLSNAVRAEGEKLSVVQRKLEKFEESLNEYETAIRQAERDLKSKKADMAERENDILSASRLLEGYTEDLKSAVGACGSNIQRDLAAFNKHIDNKKNDILRLTENRSDINYEIDRYQPEVNAIRSQLMKIENEGERRLAKLRERESDLYQAVMWLRGNRHLFSGRVYEPMILELSVKEAKNAVYIENSVGKRDLVAFTCTEKSDVNLLIQKLCNEQRLRVNVLHSNQADSCHYQSEEPIANLRKYGFYSYLLDMLEGPAPILNYLCRQYRIHKILVGTNEVEKHVDNIPRNFNVFFSEQNRFAVIISRYSGDSSSSCSRITPMNLLCADIDVQQVNELNRKLVEITRKTDSLKNNRNDIESKIGVINEEVNEIKEKKARLEGRLNQIHEKKRKVKYQEQKLNDLKNNIIDIPAEEEKFKRFNEDTINKMLQVQRSLTNCFREFQRSSEEKYRAEVKLHVYRKETIDIENQLAKAEEDYRTTKTRFERFQRTKSEITSRYQQKENEALEQCNGVHRNDRKFPYKKKFKELPNTIQELEEYLVQIKTRADCMAQYEVDIADYENRKREIEHLRSLLQNSHHEQNKMSLEMKTIHDVWHPYFSQKINAINTNFSRLMSALEFAGEVNLVYKELNDYDTYGIEILVQYRNNAKLQALDPLKQSGGERAVAIAMYSMSLQNLTHVPFRCVDEINQGMDEANERKVFNLIVDETCKIGSSQYFFITPKLLPDLNCNELLTALIVFNGDLEAPNLFNH